MAPNEGTPRGARTAGAALLVLVAIVAVAAFATGSRAGEDRLEGGLGADAGRALTDVGMFAMLTFGSLMLVVAVVVTLRRQAAGEAPLPERRPWLVPALITVGLLLVAAPLLSWVFEWIGPPETQEVEPEPVTEAPPPFAGGGEQTASDEGATPAVIGIVVGVLGAAATTAWFVGTRQRRRPPDALAEEETEEQRRDRLRGLLDDALASLLDDPDPRRAVISAWARLEVAFAAAGQPRPKAEPPADYLERVIQAVDVDRALVRRLGASFERAMFSPHAVDRAAQTEAVEALRAVRDQLLVEVEQ